MESIDIGSSASGVFMFELNQMVELRVSDEFGEVRGRAEYVNSENQYLVHYRAADGRAVSSWFDESLLLPLEDEKLPGAKVYACHTLKDDGE